MNEKKSILVKLDTELYDEVVAFAERELRGVSNAIVYLITKGMSAGAEPIVAPVRPSSSPQEPSLAAPGTDINFDDMPADMPVYIQYRRMAEESLPKQLQAELEFCQDRETRDEISARYQKEIDSCWALYHESKPS